MVFNWFRTLWSIPHPVVGTTRDYCRYIKALLSPYSGAIAVEGIDLTFDGLGFAVFRAFKIYRAYGAYVFCFCVFWGLGFRVLGSGLRFGVYSRVWGLACHQEFPCYPRPVGSSLNG